METSSGERALDSPGDSMHCKNLSCEGFSLVWVPTMRDLCFDNSLSHMRTGFALQGWPSDQQQSFVDFNLGVPPCFMPALPFLPYFLLAKHSSAGSATTSKTKLTKGCC